MTRYRLGVRSKSENYNNIAPSADDPTLVSPLQADSALDSQSKMTPTTGKRFTGWISQWYPFAPAQWICSALLFDDTLKRVDMSPSIGETIDDSHSSDVLL